MCCISPNSSVYLICRLHTGQHHLVSANHDSIHRLQKTWLHGVMCVSPSSGGSKQIAHSIGCSFISFFFYVRNLNMPYVLKKVKIDGKMCWSVRNADSGAVKSKHTDLESAKRQIRLLNALDHNPKLFR